MRMILSCALMAFLAVGVSADDKKEEKIDTKKLIGKWEPKEDNKEKVVAEFMKDGKVTISIGDANKLEGTYKVDGNKLTLVIKGDEKLNTITKLTDTEMETKDGAGKVETYLRIKDK